MSNTYDADHRWQNMCAMLDRLGLDASVLAHGRLASDLRSAVASCLHCSADEHCSEWLVRAPENLEKAPGFCPNAELFAAVRETVARGADNKIP